MSYLPALCDSCGDVSLYSEKTAQKTSLECPRCHEMPRVIPSRSYTVHDVEIFAELSETVGHSLSALEAYHLSVEVEKALSSSRLDSVFEPLVLRWPGLVPLFVVVGSNVSRQKRSLQMLKTIFDALSLTRRSGTMVRADAASAPLARCTPASAAPASAALVARART
jgi:hypothetical protein